jgi:general stress protein YciG
MRLMPVFFITKTLFLYFLNHEQLSLMRDSFFSKSCSGKKHLFISKRDERTNGSVFAPVVTCRGDAGFLARHLTRKGGKLMSTQEQEGKEYTRTDVSKRPSGKMTVEEAGRRGGERTAQTRGHEFYQSIGRKGGEVVSKDKQHMAAIGRKGGEAVSRDRAHMALIGQKGGEARSRHFKKQQLEKKKLQEAQEKTQTAQTAEGAAAHEFSKPAAGEQEKAG